MDKANKITLKWHQAAGINSHQSEMRWWHIIPGDSSENLKQSFSYVLIGHTHEDANKNTLWHKQLAISLSCNGQVFTLHGIFTAETVFKHCNNIKL